MNVSYKGDHSIAFIKIANLNPVVTRSWDEMHLIPSSRPFVAPASPKLSFVSVPGTTLSIDMTSVIAGEINYSRRSGSWDFIIDHNQWDQWFLSYEYFKAYFNGDKIVCVLADDPEVAYSGRVILGGYSPGEEYTEITLNYDFDYEYDNSVSLNGLHVLPEYIDPTPDEDPVPVYDSGVYEYRITISNDSFPTYSPRAYDKDNSFNINWGDYREGVGRSGTHPSHMYNQNGSYTVRITANLNTFKPWISNKPDVDDSLLRAIIPLGAKDIPDYAFINCPSLEVLYFPNTNTMTRIGDFAFYGCEGLNHVEKYTGTVNIQGNINTNYTIKIPNGVTYIGTSAFNGCKLIQAIDLPSTLITIGNSSFRKCTSLTSVSLPNGLKNIGGYSFEGCESVASISIPNSVEAIGGAAFSGCSSLTSITIPVSVLSLDGSTFQNCVGIESVTFEQDNVSGETIGIYHIGDYEFYNCINLSQIQGTSKLEHIGVSAFGNCKSLSSFTVPEFISELSPHTFNGCINLTSITTSTNMCEIGSNCFENCSSLSSINISDLEVVTGDTIWTNYLAELTHLDIIEDSAFKGCSSITEIWLPDNVNLIGKGCFYSCSSLTRIRWPLNASITSIESDTFARCTSLTTLTTTNDDTDNTSGIYIPQEITEIGRYAFGFCENITTLVFPQGIKRIGNYAFSGCKRLRNVTIPVGVEYIGSYAFSDCAKTIDNVAYSLTITIQTAEVPQNPELIYEPPIIDIGTKIFGGANNIIIYIKSDMFEYYLYDEKWSEYAAYMTAYD